MQLSKRHGHAYVQATAATATTLGYTCVHGDGSDASGFEERLFQLWGRLDAVTWMGVVQILPGGRLGGPHRAGGTPGLSGTHGNGRT